MQPVPRSIIRPAGTGPFFDYVVDQTHQHALRMRRVRAAAARQRRSGRQTSAERRWEGEGGSMRECAPHGGRT